MSEEEQLQEPQFEVGERVVIREDFHSKYFQGLPATIAGPARKGGADALLWPLKLEVEPHEMLIHGKYLRRPDEEIPVESVEAPQSSTSDGSNQNAKGSFLTRIIPWRRK